MMPTYSEFVHSGLPQVLFTRKDGQPRQNSVALKDLSDEDLDTIEAHRDALLSNYAPKWHSAPYAHAEYGVVEGSTITTVTAGEKYSTPGWVRDELGHMYHGTIEKSAPYLVVPREDRTTKYAPAWRSSTEMWLQHLTGGRSIFPCWKSEAQVSVILMDIDVRDPDIYDHLSDAALPFVAAFQYLSEYAGVDLRPLFRVSGAKGFWIELHLETPILKKTAAEFMMATAMAVAAMGFKVAASPELLNTVDDGWDEDCELYHVASADYIIDIGNANAKVCRMPAATHQDTMRISEFFDPETGCGLVWHPLDPAVNQVQLMRHGADEVELAIVNRLPLFVAKGRDAGEVSHYLSETRSLSEDAGDEHRPSPDEDGVIADIVITQEDLADDAPGQPGGQLSYSLNDRCPLLSGWAEDEPHPASTQWVRSIENIVSSEPCAELEIPDIYDGETNYQLTYGGILFRIYSYLNATEGIYDENDVWKLLRAHLMGQGKEKMVRGLIHRDFERGTHRRQGGYVPTYVDRVRAACTAAGINVATKSGNRTFEVLAYLAHKHWHGDDTYTSLEIAKSLGLPTDADDINASRHVVDNQITRLRKLGLIERTQVGNPKLDIPCSRCDLAFAIRDEVADLWDHETNDADDLDAEFYAIVA